MSVTQDYKRLKASTFNAAMKAMYIALDDARQKEKTDLENSAYWEANVRVLVAAMDDMETNA